MNKKVLFLAVGLIAATTGTFAQKNKLREANKYLKKAQEAKAASNSLAAVEAYEKAKAEIDQVVENDETKGNAEAWLTKAAIYVGMQDQPDLRSGNPYKEGMDAIQKALDLNKKLETNEDAINIIANISFFAYNEGIQEYNDSKFGESYNLFNKSTRLLGKDKDKRFVLMPIIDTIRAQSKLMMGYTAFYDKKIPEAITLLQEMKTSPYLENESNIYLVLSQAYEAQGKTAEQLAVLQEGKKRYPSDKNIIAAELNYYIASGQQEAMTQKLEEAIASDPNNPELYVNLGIVYSGMSEATGLGEQKSKELRDKAEAALKTAVAKAPENGTYNYHAGVFYFNQAVTFNSQMADLGGTKAEIEKYNVLLGKRNHLLDQALPYLEKSRQIFSARPNKLNTEEKKYYYECLTALKDIYVLTDNEEKAGELKRTLQAFD